MSRAINLCPQLSFSLQKYEYLVNLPRFWQKDLQDAEKRTFSLQYGNNN